MNPYPINKAFTAAALLIFFVFLLAASTTTQAQTSERLREGAGSPSATAGTGGGVGATGGTGLTGGVGTAGGVGTGPAINTYLKDLYFWFLGVVGISALFAIVFGGVLYMFSGTSLTKVEQAKHWISNAIFGILLAGGSYVLLKAINPDFTEHGFDLTNSINRLLPPPARSTSAPAATPNNPAGPGVDQPVTGGNVMY